MKKNQLKSRLLIGGGFKPNFSVIPIKIRTYPGALHEREGECQKAPTYGILKVDLRKSRFKGNFSTT